MSTALESVHQQARLLPQDERAELALRMLATLEPEDDDVETAWQTELTRRVANIRQGKVNCITEEQMMKEIEEVLQ